MTPFAFPDLARSFTVVTIQHLFQLFDEIREAA